MKELKDIRIAVAGTGYVGLSMATLLAQHHPVVAVDVIPEKVEKINQRISPIQDEYIEQFFAEKPLQLTATLDGATAYRDADFVIIAAPTIARTIASLFSFFALRFIVVLLLKLIFYIMRSVPLLLLCAFCRAFSFL